MKSKLFIVAFVVVTLAVSFSAAMGFWPFGQSATEAWLERIGLPDGAAYVGEPDISELDGTSPEMLLQEVAMEGDPESIREAFRQRCLAAGMQAPQAGSVKSEPETICDIASGSGVTAFIVSTDCSVKPCKVFLRLNHF